MQQVCGGNQAGNDGHDCSEEAKDILQADQGGIHVEEGGLLERSRRSRASQGSGEKVRPQPQSPSVRASDGVCRRLSQFRLPSMMERPFVVSGPACVVVVARDGGVSFQGRCLQKERTPLALARYELWTHFYSSPQVRLGHCHIGLAQAVRSHDISVTWTYGKMH